MLQSPRLQHWPITFSSPYNATLCYLLGYTYYFCFSVGRYSTGGLLWDFSHQWGAQPLVGAFHDWQNFFWSQAETNSKLSLTVSQVGKQIYHFITLTHFRWTTSLLPLVFTGMSCAENLWLMAWSRVNMQQTEPRNIRLFFLISFLNLMSNTKSLPSYCSLKNYK